MFEDIEKYFFLREIKESLPLIQAEFFGFVSNYKINLTNNDVIDNYGDWWVKDNGFHSNITGYDIRGGAYSIISFFKKDFPVKTFEVEKYFPKSLMAVSAVPNLHYASFFIMNPGASLDEHTHNRKHLIYHMLLNDLHGGVCELTCSGHKKNLKYAGDQLLFDYSQPHSSINQSEDIRVNLVVDFTL